MDRFSGDGGDSPAGPPFAAFGKRKETLQETLVSGLQQTWTLLGSRDVSDHRIFRLRHDRYRLEPTGREREFVVLEAPDWVNVVPLTDDGQIVLIRQYRHGTRRVDLEIPGGMIDADESAQTAALRELREETGYVPRRIRALGRVSPNPAIQDNHCYFYVAEGCHRVGPLHLDPFERIEVELHPLAEVPELVRQEQICHGLVLNALGYLGLVPSGSPEWTEIAASHPPEIEPTPGLPSGHRLDS